MFSKFALWVFVLGVNALTALLVFHGIRVDYPIPKERISREEENAYIVEITYSWPLAIHSDSLEHPRYAGTRLLENNVKLGPPHQKHDAIRKQGTGGFSHWQQTVYFSSSDNTDPRTNGREYVASIKLQVDVVVFWIPFLLTAMTLLSLSLVHIVSALRRGTITKRDPGTFCLSLFFTLFGCISSLYTWGIGWWLATFVALCGVTWSVSCGFTLLKKIKGWAGRDPFPVANISLTLSSIFCGVVMFEGYLSYIESRAGSSPAGSQNVAAVRSITSQGLSIQADAILQSSEQSDVQLPPDIAARAAWRNNLLSLPMEYQRQSRDVQHSVRAYVWHGALHVYDHNNMRRVSPFPPKVPDVFRVIVVGDSLTYGVGIEENWTYPAILQRTLDPEYRIEFLNLGVSGYQSEDMLRNVRRFVPELKPDLVIYGVCHNDFLPSGLAQYGGDQYSFPLPGRLKKLITDRTRAGRFVDKAYDSFLLRLGLRTDFYDDILQDFTGYQERFARDVEAMNAFAVASGLPPVVAIVLDQFPKIGSRGHNVSSIAERYLKSAGMTVIETEPYYKRYHGRVFTISRWEGHPNEYAQVILASMIRNHLVSRADLAHYRRRTAETRSSK